MLSASLIFTTLFLPPPVRPPVSSISWWHAERGVPQALSAAWNSSPPSPVQLQQEEETFLLFCEWGISMATVQSLNYSSILDQQGKKSPAGTSGAPLFHPQTHTPLFPLPPPPSSPTQHQPHITNTDFLTYFNHKEPLHRARLEYRKQPSSF